MSKYIPTSQYDDQKFPQWYLQKALGKLKKYGMDTFLAYAEEIKMPFTDQNRVIAKCNVAYKTHHRQMSCPEQLRNERFRIYTKVYGYPKDKALEYINRLDSR